MKTDHGCASVSHRTDSRSRLYCSADFSERTRSRQRDKISTNRSGRVCSKGNDLRQQLKPNSTVPDRKWRAFEIDPGRCFDPVVNHRMGTGFGCTVDSPSCWVHRRYTSRGTGRDDGSRDRLSRPCRISAVESRWKPDRWATRILERCGIFHRRIWNRIEQLYKSSRKHLHATDIGPEVYVYKISLKHFVRIYCIYESWAWSIWTQCTNASAGSYWHCPCILE